MRFPENRFFTGVRDPGAERIVRGAIAGISEAVRGKSLPEVAGIFLGGGYGRGEGGVFRCPDGTVKLYNDLDFFVFSHPVSRKRRKSVDSVLSRIGDDWSARLGIDVEFSPAKVFSSVKKLERTLRFQELKHGNFCICGDPSIPERLKELSPSELPVIEAVRLLANRGMGLALAGSMLHEKNFSAGFFLRNVNKAVLGTGDALLIAEGRYQWSGAERVLAFRKTAPEYASAYESAFRWKLEPAHGYFPGGGDPGEMWEKARHLWMSAVILTVGAEIFAKGGAEQALHVFSGKEKCVSLKNGLRWILKTRSAAPLNMLFDDPSVKILAQLYLIFTSCDIPEEQVFRASKLHRNWLLFN